MLKTFVSRLERIIRSRQAYKFFVRDWSGFKDLDVSTNVLQTMRASGLLEPLMMEVPRGQQIIVIAPHTDDETIGPGGTLLKAIARGSKVRVLYLTTNTPNEISRGEAAEVSRKGGYEIDFLDFPVGDIPVDLKSAGLLAARIGALQPDHLFVPFFMDDNDDHRRTNELLLAAGEGGSLSSDIEVWAYQVYGVVPANVMVDITDVAEAKANLIRCWHTQMKRRDWAHYALGINAFNCRFMSGRADRCYGEAFFVLPLGDYLDLCRRFFANPSQVYRSTYAGKSAN